MLFSRGWLQDYIEEGLPSGEELADKLGLHSFEIESQKQLGDDFVIDIDILPNRAHDALSYLGMAMEVSTIFSLKFKMPEMPFEKSEYSSGDYITLDIEDPKLVRRATKKIIRDIKVDDSPDWLRERLEATGQRSINNIVDITNFVMYEFGQPLHAFDYDKLHKSKVKGDSGRELVNIHIRGAKVGEKIKLLDGKEIELEEGMLVIADDEKALDIAGIKGGAVSGIDENTKNIMVSVCSFEPSNIRRTSKTLGFRTDASMRFERDIAPELVPEALHRICHLVKELVGGEVSSDYLDVYPRPLNPYKLGVTLGRVNKILGTSVTGEEVESIFTRLGFKYEKLTPVKNVVARAQDYIGVPYLYGASVRADAPRSFDCSSFASYLYAESGMAIPCTSIDQYVFGEKIKEKDLRSGDLVFSNSGSGNIWTETQEYMKGTEVPEGIDHIGIYMGDGRVIHATRYKNGVVMEDLKTSEQFKNIIGYCRIPSSDMERYVVTAPSYRLDLRIEEDLIEEIGRVYGYQNIKEEEPHSGHGPVVIHKEFYWINKIKDILVDAGFSEVHNYTFVSEGEVELENSLSADKGFLRTDMSKGIEASLVLGNLHAPIIGFEKIKVFEIGTVFDKDGEHVELLASADVSEILSSRLGLKVADGAINITKLLEKLVDPKDYNDLAKIDFGDSKFSNISPYPFVLRDIALWVPMEVESFKVYKVIKENGGELLIKIDLFDEFEKEGRVSYGFRLVFQSHEKTLTDIEVNEIMDSITKELNGNDGWSVR